jgi:hypothetical protein
VVREFERLRLINIPLMIPSVPVPPILQITSFLSHHRKILRGGKAFGATTLEDIEEYALSKAYGKSIYYVYIFIYIYLFMYMYM